MQCESCLEKGAEIDGLVDGEYKKLCRGCALMEGAVVVPPASNKSIQDLYKRATVREVLSRMSGVNRPVIDSYKMEKKEVSLDSLRARSSTYKAPRKNFNDQNVQIPQITAQTTAVQAVVAAEAQSVTIEEEKKPGFFKKLFSFGKKEKTPNPQEGPSVDREEQKERLGQLRRELSADETLEL